MQLSRIAESLQVNSKAEANGKKNLPASDSILPDIVEQSIIQKIESEWVWQGGEFVNNLRAYAARLNGFSADAEFAQLRLKADHALTQLRAAHHRAEAELEPLRQSYFEARKEFEAFRALHGLTRPVREAGRPWTTIGLLFVMVALEAILNGFFFAKGASLGLMGGVGTGIGISLVNILFGFGIGLVPARWINHPNIAVKVTGYLLAAVGIGALLTLHAFAAQLRDLSGTIDAGRLTAAAFERLTTTPWSVNDFSSLYLFGLGMLLAIIAMGKGYRLDDPFPGYGPASRRVINARAEYSGEHSDLFDDLETIKDDAIKTLEDGLARIPLFPQQTAAIQTQRNAIIQKFRSYETAVATAVNQLLAKYRSVNCEHRTSPPPTYFNERWELPYRFVASLELENLAEDGHRSLRDIPATLQQLRQLSQEVLAEYEGLMAKFPHAI